MVSRGVAARLRLLGAGGRAGGVPAARRVEPWPAPLPRVRPTLLPAPLESLFLLIWKIRKNTFIN